MDVKRSSFRRRGSATYTISPADDGTIRAQPARELSTDAHGYERRYRRGSWRDGGRRRRREGRRGYRGMSCSWRRCQCRSGRRLRCERGRWRPGGCRCECGRGRPGWIGRGNWGWYRRGRVRACELSAQRGQPALKLRYGDGKADVGHGSAAVGLLYPGRVDSDHFAIAVDERPPLLPGFRDASVCSS